MEESPSTTEYLPRGVVSFFASWRFPTFLLAAMGALTLPVVVVIVAPKSGTGLGRLARDFATWCFGYDATAGIDWAYLLFTISNPALIGVVVVGIWWRPLRQGWRDSRTALIRWALYGVLAVVAVGAGIAAFGPSPIRGASQPFPASRLRTEIEPPTIELVDQNRKPVALEDYEGRVVLVTAVYASCQTVCPRMVERIDRAVGSLSPEQRSQVVVLAVTLDPERDTPERLAEMADRHGVGAPRYHFLTGGADEVRRTLRDLGVSWSRDPETGMIQHSSLFVLVDAEGSIAYRLTLGARDRSWLYSALDVLTAEALDD